MLVRKLLVAAAVIGILTVTGRTYAQYEPREATVTGGTYAQDEPEKPMSFIERLDAFGKSVFGGLLPSKKRPAKPSETSRPSATSEPAETYQRPESAQRDLRVVPRDGMLPDGSDDQRAVPRAGSVLVKPGPESTLNNDPTLSMDRFLPKRTQPPARPQAVAETVETAKPAPRLLYQRMEAFRKSPFNSDDGQSGVGQPRNAQPRRPADVIVRSEKKEKEDGGWDIDSLYPEDRPIVARRVAPAAPAVARRPAEPIYEPEDDRTAAVETRPKAAADSPSVEPIYEADHDRTAAIETRPKPSVDARASENAPGARTLFARKGPVLSVKTMGPRTIVVGRESTYQVQMTELGRRGCRRTGRTRDVAGMGRSRPHRGQLGRGQTARGGARGGHRLERRPSRRQDRAQHLTMRIIPRQSRPFDLAVRWESKPIASQAMIEVQEPKLSLQLEGPREVPYGKKELYRLKLANTGNGNAENVTIVMTPIGTGENLPASHKVGLLAAGKEKSLEVELTARQGGI